MKLIEIHVVAAPREHLVVGGEHHSRNVIHGTVCAVMPGDPFGSSQGERAGGHWQIHLGVKELARRVCKVGGDLNRGFRVLGPGGPTQYGAKNRCGAKCSALTTHSIGSSLDLNQDVHFAS